MLTQIRGLHHVTSMASDARASNAFFTDTLGLRRVKKTVNFDAPEVYHLYYGDERGTPGSVMTYFPFPDIGPRAKGTGEVGQTVFAVPKGAMPFWQDRLAARGVAGITQDERFGARRLSFAGPDGDELALLETDDTRAPWTGGGVPEDAAIRGFHSVALRLRDAGATDELLRLMGYEPAERSDDITRYLHPAGNGADAVDLETLPGARRADIGAGSVHHVAFAVPDRAAQLEVRKALLDAGCQVTPVIDRDYFWSIYFRTPGGVLFEVATERAGVRPRRGRRASRRGAEAAEATCAPEGVAGAPPGADRMSAGYAYHAEGVSPGKPLVLAFHGTGGSETQFAPLIRELVPGAGIVAPRGDVTEHGALRFFRRRGEGVYDMEDLAARTAAMAGFVATRVAEAQPSRVVGLGYSNGANILASVIFARPDLFDQAVLMHPLIPWTPEPAPVRARVLITAGRRDPICPPEATAALADWFAAQGAQVETVWHPGGHEIDRTEIAAVARFLS